jgi:uncharacterized surface protein with fasciclin (FAS1) repeats
LGSVRAVLSRFEVKIDIWSAFDLIGLKTHFLLCLHTILWPFLVNIDLSNQIQIDMTKRFFAIIRYTTLLAIVAGLFVLNGCDKEDDKPTKTVYELISDDPTLSMIKAQVDLNAELKAKLQDPAGTYTFYAPNDLAMGAILTTLGLPNFQSIAPATLSVVLNYHLAPKAVYAADMSNGAKVTTAQGEDITIEVTSAGSIKLKTGATTNGTILTSDIKGTNGVVHVVGDYPLVPPTIGGLIVATLGKVAQPILLSSSFSILSSAIQKADAGKPAAETIVGAMVAQTAQTFFATPDAVFNAAGITVNTYTSTQWNSIIRGHMVPGSTVATLADANLGTMLGKSVTTTSTTVKGSANVNAITVVTASKIQTSNGVIFPIQGVIQHNP